MDQVECQKYERLLGRVTNSVQLEKFVHAIESAEAQLRDELDDYIDSRNHVQESKKIELARTELSTTLNNSSNLVNLLSNAGSLASKITARVRLLDAERARVSETSEYVAKVKELKTSVLAVNAAFEQHDWESAARTIGTIRTLPRSGEFINAVVPSTDVPEIPQVVVDKWIDQLTDLFSSEFSKAAEARDVPRLTKLFSLFPLIGKEAKGLDCYSIFICNIIASQSRLIITNQSQQDIVGFYPAALMKLLEIVSTMINQHSHVIAKYYGLSHMTGIIERVERETDSQAGLIGDTFYDHRHFARTIDEIQLYSFPLLSNNSQSRNSPSPRGSGEYKRMSEEGISVVMIGDLATELSSFLHYWSLYCKFIAVKWNEYKGIDQEELKLPTPILESKFFKKIQGKFLPTFEVFSTFYVRRSLEQAFQIEEFPDLNVYIKQLKSTSPESPPVSSAMEDFIMVVSTALKQAIETGQPVTVKNIINNVKKILESDYIMTLHKRLKDLHPRSGAVLQASTTASAAPQPKQQNTVGSIFMRGANALNQIAAGEDTRLHTFIILLNTVSLGSIYFDKIIKQNTSLLATNYPFGSDATKLETIISSVNDQFKKRSQGILDEQVQILFNQVLKNKLKILLTDCFKDVDYLISSYDEDDNVVTRRFVQSWNALISPYLKTLDSHVYDTLITTIVSTLSNLLERKLWSLEKIINELGSIKLERDFSGLIGEITHNKYSLRDKFLRVTQIIMILGFDDEEDEIDMNWVLTPSERQKARSLRVDRK